MAQGIAATLGRLARGVRAQERGPRMLSSPISLTSRWTDVVVGLA